MANKEAKSKSKKSNIRTTKTDIIVNDCNVNLSDAKLELNLQKIYEQARKDARVFKFYNLFSVFFSIGGALLVALLTSEFKSIFNISANAITIIMGVSCGVSLLAGFILLLLYAIKKDNTEKDERDKAVKELLDEIKKNKE